MQREIIVRHRKPVLEPASTYFIRPGDQPPRIKIYPIGHVPPVCPHCGSFVVFDTSTEYRSDHLWRCLKCGAGELLPAKPLILLDKKLVRDNNAGIERVCACGRTYSTHKHRPMDTCDICRNTAKRLKNQETNRLYGYVETVAKREYRCCKCGKAIKIGTEHHANAKMSKRWHEGCEYGH